jgi:phospholipid transport system substrate-binding protein
MVERARLSVQTTQTRHFPYIAAIRTMVVALPLTVARVLALYVFALAFALTTLSDAHAANPVRVNPVETFVQDSVDKGYAILNDTALSADERETRFGKFLLSVLDIKRIAAFTLGIYERGAPMEELDKFDAAFADYITAVYQQKLAAYPGQRIEVTGSTVRAADDVIVTADTVGAAPKQPSVNLAFRVRKNDNGSNSIVDVEVEGIWLALTQRDEFADYLFRHDGDIGRLGNELESRTREIRHSSQSGRAADNKG